MKIVKISLITFMLLFMNACNLSNKQRLYILNWGEYMDMELVKKFEELYNCDIIYEETSSNEAMHTKIAIGTSAYDIAFPSDYMIEKMKNDDLLLKIDQNKLNNIDAINKELYKLTSFDKTGDYYVPYFTGSVGIMYNVDLVDESDLTSWDVLWNKKYDDQIYMYDSVRDLIMVGAMKNGYSINTTDDSELKKIETDLTKQKTLVRGYATDDIKSLIVSGDGAMGLVYSGDYITAYNELISTNQTVNINYFVPNQGTNVWLDGMVIPKTSKNLELAHKFIDFMLEYENAYQNSKWVGYTTTNNEVYDTLIEDDFEFYSSTAYTLSDNQFSNSQVYSDLGKEYNQIYSDIFIRIKNS